MRLVFLEGYISVSEKLISDLSNLKYQNISHVLVVIIYSSSTSTLTTYLHVHVLQVLYSSSTSTLTTYLHVHVLQVLYSSSTVCTSHDWHKESTPSTEPSPQV